MNLTRDDFKLFDASYNHDWNEIWIEKRIFKKRFILFGKPYPTNKFEIILDGNNSSEDSPVAFSNFQEAEDYIQKLIESC